MVLVNDVAIFIFIVVALLINIIKRVFFTKK